MYVRLARFAGADPDVFERELESMREQMRSGMSEATDDDGGQGPNREQLEWLRKVTRRVLVLADREKGSSAMLVFVDSEEDARRLDEMFDQMSPSTGGGRRQSADVYEVAIDEQMSG